MDAEATRKRIEELVAQVQQEILDASQRLATAISREAEKAIPPAGEELTRLIDEVFDVAQRVIESQRKLVRDLLDSVGDALDDLPTKAPAKKAPAKKAAAKKAPAKKPAKKAASG